MPPVYFRIKRNENLEFSFLSSNTFEILGYKSEELLENGKLFWESILPEDRSRIIKSILVESPANINEKFLFLKNQTIPIPLVLRGGLLGENEELFEGFLETSNNFEPYSYKYSAFNVDGFPQLVLIFDARLNQIVFINNNLKKEWGRTEQDLLSKELSSFLELIHPDEKSVFLQKIQFSISEYINSRLFQSGVFKQEIKIKNSLGTYNSYSLSFNPYLENSEFGSDKFIFFFYDISNLDNKNPIWNEKNYKSILQNLPDLVLRFDNQAKCIFINTYENDEESLFTEDVIGKTIDEFNLNIEIVRNFKINLMQSISIGEIREYEFHTRNKKIKYYKVRFVPEIDENKTYKSCITILSDITNSKLAEQTLKFAAEHDSLTGLKNREFFLKEAERTIQLCKKTDSKCAIVLFDVDKFQEINDTLGHLIGDELLKTVGNILSEFMRPENCLSRYGGDEFSVIMKSEQSAGNFLDIFPVLMEISELFSKPVIVMDNQIYTSISMGVSIFPDDGDDPSILIQNADRAMYYSKQKEYNSFTFYKSEMNKQTSVKRDIVHSLRRAIENNEFTLVYQPKIDLRNGKVSGAEALIRWNSNGTWISPMDFIPAAEESGLIIPIGKWVLERAARDTKYIHERGYHNFRMSVNISARQFHVPGIGKFILDLLTLNDLSPEMFEVEITEGVAMKNVNLSEIILRELDSRGVKISIDDFGTGHSSLAYLKKFPIDILKIDKTFIKDIPHDKESCAIVNAVLSMSHELDIEVVAEGVEENDQLEFLRNGGCEYIQGFYYSKPVPINTLEIFLEKYNHS